jgi:hypothetical protein
MHLRPPITHPHVSRTVNVSTRTTRRWTLALCCALALSGCKMWEEPLGPAPATGRRLGTVRLTLAGDSALVLKDAQVRGDSIVGSPRGTTSQTAVALADVKKTELRHLDPVRTFWTGFLGVAAVLLVVGRL